MPTDEQKAQYAANRSAKRRADKYEAMPETQALRARPTGLTSTSGWYLSTKGVKVLVGSEGESEGGHVPRVGGQHKRQPPRAAAAKLVPVVSRHRRPQGGQGKAELEGPVNADYSIWAAY